MTIYRGKYPNRVESIGRIEKVWTVRTNSGAVYSVSVLNGKLPELGSDLADWAIDGNPMFTWEAQSEKRSAAYPVARLVGTEGELSPADIKASQFVFNEQNRQARERVTGEKAPGFHIVVNGETLCSYAGCMAGLDLAKRAAVILGRDCVCGQTDYGYACDTADALRSAGAASVEVVRGECPADAPAEPAQGTLSGASDLGALTAKDRATIDRALCLAAAMAQEDHDKAWAEGRTRDAKDSLASVQEFRKLGERFGRFNAKAR